MWIDPDDDPREEQSSGTDERSVLIDYLRRYRLTMQMKCADLDSDQLARRSVPPSTMSLLGLVRHMAEVERNWFRRVLSQEDAPPHYYSDPDDPDGDFDNVDSADVAEAFATWGAECASARDFTAATTSLDQTGLRKDGQRVSLRWVLVHMIEEYARHNGHADLLRERIDGNTGD
jgi:uncharacterized damage-inducible protein DinB